MLLRVVAVPLAAAIVLAGLAIPGKADTNIITKAGVWEAFGGTTANGRPVCGVSSSAGDRYFGVKFFSGDATFTIQMGTKSWRIENGTKQKLEMIMDGHPPWNATGTGMHFNDGDAGLEFTINRSELDQFYSEFRGSSRMLVRLGGSDAAEWMLNLSGSNAVSDAFMQCIRGLR